MFYIYIYIHHHILRNVGSTIYTYSGVCHAKVQTYLEKVEKKSLNSISCKIKYIRYTYHNSENNNKPYHG